METPTPEPMSSHASIFLIHTLSISAPNRPVGNTHPLTAPAATIYPHTSEPQLKSRLHLHASEPQLKSRLHLHASEPQLKCSLSPHVLGVRLAEKASLDLIDS